MTIGANYFERTLRAAEQQELIDGDETLMASMHEIMTPEVVNKGMHISFGSDRRALDKVLNVLNIEDMLHSEPQGLHIHNAITFTPGITSFLGRTIPALENLLVLDAVDALQADRWTTYKEHEMYTHLQIAHERVTSQLIITSPISVDGEKATDITKPGLIVGATYRYLPEFGRFDDYGPSLESYIEDAQQDMVGRENTVGKLAIELVTTDEGLAMPSASYFIQIGSLTGGMFGTINGVRVRNEYKIVRGKLEAFPDEDEALEF